MNKYTEIITKQFRGCGFMTIAKYNNSGDIIYIADKDSQKVTAVETFNYSIIGIFEGHNGIIWSLDISSDDTILVTSSGDLTIGFWNTLDGTLLYKSLEVCIPKIVCIQKNSQLNLVAIACEALSKKSKSYISIYDINDIKNNIYSEKIKLIWDYSFKFTTLLWLNDEILIIGCDDGKIILKDINDIEGTNDIEHSIFHTDSIKSIIWNKMKTQILTSSLDCTSKQIDINSWEIKAIYKSTVPINYACFNHNDRKVLIGGGIEAMNIAKTSNNDLNLKIYRASDQKLMNHISSHFGPIRFIDKSPINKNFISASQDGTVKIYFIKDENDINEKLTDISEIKTFNKFGCTKYQDSDNLLLSTEINKLENLHWKPPKIKEEKNIKWIPGMPIKSNSVNNKEINNRDSNNNIDTNQNSNLFKIKSHLNNSTNVENKEENKEENNDSNLFQFKSYISSDNNNNHNNNNNYNYNRDQNINTTIRITNLPPDIDNKDLAEIFDLYGRIDEKNGIKIVYYYDTTMAFIKYMFSESTEKAIKNMNGVSLGHYIIGVELSKCK